MNYDVMIIVHSVTGMTIPHNVLMILQGPKQKDRDWHPVADMNRWTTLSAFTGKIGF